jgi:flagellar basal-body rod protein FlgG
VRAAGGGHLKLVPGQPVEILADGTVRQGGQTVGQLELAEPDPASLSKHGNAYFRMAGTRAAPAASTTIAQGQLEDSNVTPAESTVRLVSLMRQFEMLQKAVSLGAEMNRHAVEELARPGT